MNDEVAPPPPEPPFPARPERKPFGLIIIVFLVLALFALAGAVRPGRGASAQQDKAFPEIMSGDLSLKKSYLLEKLGKTESSRSARQSALSVYSRVADTTSSPRALRRVAVLSEDPSAALTAFMKMGAPKTLTLVPRIDRPSIRREVAMWKRVYSGALLSAAEARSYVAFLRQIDLGPARYIAEARIYRSAGMSAQAEMAERLPRSRYTNQLMALAAIVILAALLGLAGAIGLIVMITMPSASSKFLSLADKPEEDARLQDPLWLSFLAYLLALLSASIVASLVAANAIDRLPWIERANYVIGVELAAHVIIALLAILILRYFMTSAGGSLRSVGLRSRNALADVVWGIGGYAVALPLLGIGALLSGLVQRLIPQAPTPIHPIMPMLLNSSTPWAMLGVFVLAAVVAPFVEETFFRGVFFRALRARFGVWPGILLSAAAFAAVHPLPVGFFPILALGITFAVLLHARESVLPGMVAHAIHNGGLILIVSLAFRA